MELRSTEFKNYQVWMRIVSHGRRPVALTCELLLAKGADVNLKKDNRGQTPLHVVGRKDGRRVDRVAKGLFRAVR